MPTYTCSALAGRLTPVAKRDIANAITAVHHETTGAPTFFAQVLFADIAPENYFVGGVPLRSDQIFVRGEIRAGRSAKDKHNLISRLIQAVCEAAGMLPACVWVYIAELPAKHMAEFGHILPEPGGEGRWMDELPPADRKRMLGIGTHA